MTIFLKVIGLAILGPVFYQNFYYVGAKLTNASFASALYNILPAVTFIMAVVLRIEKLNAKCLHSQAKVIRTLVTVDGALIITLYNGPAVEFFWSRGTSHHDTDAGAHDQSHWLIGTIMLLASCICWGIVLGAVITLVMERGSKPWVVGWDMRLVTARNLEEANVFFLPFSVVNMVDYICKPVAAYGRPLERLVAVTLFLP